jgi:crotonobetainyl-CoA:carnitine CoA-transferase CaiB-like acyl-CoA transferase
MQQLPLTGIRVLDFCQMWAGPHATEWLSVLGAEVIKLETGNRIDYMRTVGAPQGLAGTGPDVGSAFASLNWGKKSITLNMALPKAHELAKRLIKKCDVVAENFGGGVLERWGLSYLQMQELKSDIIYYAGSGYGRSGPYKERPAYAEIVDAFSGATFANGYPGGEPCVVGVSPWTDGAQAMHGAYAILAAVYYHQQTGRGQYIDAAMIEGSANFLGEAVMANILTGRDVERKGNRDPAMAPHAGYPCKITRDESEWIVIAIQRQKEWKKLCSLMHHPAWTKEAIYADELSRWKNQDTLDQHLADWTRQFGAYELAARLQASGITASASLSTKQATHDEHLNTRGFFISTEHPVLGKVTLTGLPLRIGSRSAGNYKRAPILGEDNNYVFAELLGLSPEEIQKLSQEKVIS